MANIVRFATSLATRTRHDDDDDNSNNNNNDNIDTLEV
jgi:hypothetical protein